MWEPDSRFGIGKQQQLLLTHRGVYKVYGGVSREIFAAAWGLQVVSQHRPFWRDHINLTTTWV